MTMLGRINGVNIATLADWQNATLQDAHSKAEDPLFKDNTYLKPIVGSGILSAGTAIASVTTDIEGIARTGNTLGAYENPFTISLPSVQTDTLYTCLQNTATTSGTILTPGGSTIIDKGMVLAKWNNPTTTIYNKKISLGGGVAAINCSWSGLLSNTTYYVRAYAENYGGVSYGSNLTFTTLPDYSAPTIQAVATTNITSNSAKVGGSVSGNGNSALLASGFVWGLTDQVTLTSNMNYSTDGPITGTFPITYYKTITNLTPVTTYYVKAYSTNNIGTTYASVLSFTTLVEGYTVSGTVSYAQYAEDPTNTKILLTKSTFKAMPKAPLVSLINATTGLVVDTATADATTGAFAFTRVPDGAYRLSLDTNMTWTSTKGYQLSLVDYKYIKEYTISSVGFDSLQMRAANIDRSGSGVNKASITLSDAGYVTKRVIGVVDPNWRMCNYNYAIETSPSNATTHTPAIMNLNMTIIVSGSDKTDIKVRGLSTGDVNGVQ